MLSISLNCFFSTPILYLLSKYKYKSQTDRNHDVNHDQKPASRLLDKILLFSTVNSGKPLKTKLQGGNRVPEH